ncbi:hypothetical protein DOM22_12575 [Bdellovibrio sp. ZAP7]|uniref:hypothetical protein n=1 Tax=Bdellovibrio sp. ZAP7 TaxID=2231053 RepID=UPI0011586E36|nr:hypothetical protein [Bdellovibrio sp. ZAP7]QDK45926.1 hypothetical protein DOM22_12575 [Bdellovibrio sp. ZAP7]
MFNLFLLAIFNLNSAWACFAPPQSAMVPLEEMVQSNENIYVAEAVHVGRTARVPVFKFKVIETLKGKSVSTMKIEGHRAKDEKSFSDFDGHKDETFWSNNTSGRLINDPSCEVQPTFTKGTRYLIFPKQPYTYKSFEIVKTNDDKFLQKVRELVIAQKK